MMRRPDVRKNLRRGVYIVPTLFTMLKIAVLAPIPNASVSTATTVNPGDFHKMRSP